MIVEWKRDIVALENIVPRVFPVALYVYSFGDYSSLFVFLLGDHKKPAGPRAKKRKTQRERWGIYAGGYMRGFINYFVPRFRRLCIENVKLGIKISEGLALYERPRRDDYICEDFYYQLLIVCELELDEAGWDRFYDTVLVEM